MFICYYIIIKQLRRKSVKEIHVVAGILKNVHGEILCTQRDVSKNEEVSFKWEFPGGKIEEGETHVQALIRELQEELNLDVKVGEFFTEVQYQYSTFKLVMYVYLCSCENFNIQALVHKDYKWMNVKDLDTLDWVPADIPIVNKLKLNA